MLTFCVAGRPVPAVRQTRYSRYGKDVRRVEAIERYDTYKDKVGWAARQAGADPERPFVDDLFLHCTVFVKARGTFDGDNVLKSIADALQLVAFTNDRQIADWRLRIVAGWRDEYVVIELGTLAELARREATA